jgi:hypothetical protein
MLLELVPELLKLDVAPTKAKAKEMVVSSVFATIVDSWLYRAKNH